MSGSLVLVGGGGHAKVVADAARAAGFNVAGFVDDDPEAKVPALEWLGGLDRAREPWIVCIGDVGTRMRVLGSLHGQAAMVLHPAAILSERVEIGLGAFVGPGAVVNADAVVEDHAIVNSAAVVEHDARVGRGSHVAPGAVLCGNVDVGVGCLIGAGAVVLPGVGVGDGAIVGAGAVVTGAVPPRTRAVGVPARLLDARGARGVRHL
ncbi:MAG: NeuD/PglB/VioB family sugar acetyltransferase [Phycisphaera sp.]|nr:MAG: NeuD/PglB/VioB family sugar acetyltransferase [Phycisphaera sp.]